MVLTARIQKASWTLRRFGLTPSKLLKRLSPGQSKAPSIVCISIPKSGTHLLERALCLHPDLYRKLLPTLHVNNIEIYGGLASVLENLRNGQIVVCHLRYSREDEALLAGASSRVVFIHRDPRDVLVSEVFYAMKRKTHWAHEVYAKLPHMRNRLRVAIEGDPTGQLVGIRHKLERFAGWLDSDCFSLCFEDLIGAKGGGEASTQSETLTSLHDYLGWGTSKEYSNELSRKLFGVSSPTFRKGQIGQWKQYFDDELTGLFNREVGSLMQRFGYAVE